VSDYPLTSKRRQTLRAELLAKGRARGEWEAAKMMRSIRCRGRQAAYGPEHEPCGNNGAGCLCQCHDQALGPAAGGSGGG
jgi:hypothetical protein